MRRASPRLGSSPTMIGALTVIVVILAVFLAYNANSGLPFTPTYKLSVQVPNAGTLVPGNEVRVGGVRVGQVEAVEPVAQEDGTATAKLDLRLDTQVDPLPEDSTVVVRSRSALGLKYLEVQPGESPQGLPEGSLLTLAAARPEPVELDEVLDTFDPRTRAAIQVNLREFGNAFAGRGGDLNAAIGELRPLVDRLVPVARNLAAPRTRLDRLFPAIARAAAEVAPVAARQAHMFVALDETFAALAGVARPYIQETITEAPRTEQALIVTGPRIRGFLANSAALFGDLQPGAAALAENAPAIEAAVLAGAEALPRAPQLNRRIPPLAAALREFNDDPRVRAGLVRLTETMHTLDTTTRFATPAQTVCNYATLLFRNSAGMLSQGDGLGRWQRFIVFDPPTGGEEPNNEGIPASAPAAGPATENYLHVNPYPNTAAPGQEPRECEAGNEPYIAGRQVIGNAPGDQGASTGGEG